MGKYIFQESIKIIYSWPRKELTFDCVRVYTLPMTTTEIAKQCAVSRFFIRKVETGKRKTTIIPLAQAIAEKNGTKAITYVSPSMRVLALKIYPELGRKSKRI